MRVLIRVLGGDEDAVCVWGSDKYTHTNPHSYTRAHPGVVPRFRVLLLFGSLRHQQAWGSRDHVSGQLWVTTHARTCALMHSRCQQGRAEVIYFLLWGHILPPTFWVTHPPHPLPAGGYAALAAASLFYVLGWFGDWVVLAGHA